MIDMITVQQLLVEVRKMIGQQFVHQGRSPGAGVDCIGMGLVAVKNAGLDLQSLTAVDLSYTAYGREPSPTLYEAVKKVCVGIPEPVPGCGLLMQMRGAKWPHHWGIYTEKGTFVHAESIRKKAVVEQTFGRPWTTFLHSCWKIPGVKYE